MLNYCLENECVMFQKNNGITYINGVWFISS